MMEPFKRGKTTRSKVVTDFTFNCVLKVSGQP
jgi:hypothetical protein